MRRFFVFLGVVLTTIGSAVRAQEVDSMAPLQMSSWGDAKTEEVIDYMPNVSLDARFGYDHYFTDGSGHLGGDGLYLDIDGKISSNLSYRLNHRIASTFYADNSGFNGTNWLTLTYEFGDFDITAGKDVLLVGSFEYDADDLDSYYDMNSMFYNMIDCWQWGVTGSWYPAEGQSFSLQFATSPFSAERQMFSYNAAWWGEWDFYESYWTVNMWQFDQNRYVKALNLANRFYLGDFTLDIEYLTRAADISTLFRNDFTFIAAPSYEVGEFLRIFGKFGLERTATDLPYELAYEDCLGTNYLFYGAGIEYFPLKENKDLRLHAAWSSNNLGDNYLNVGLKLRMRLTDAARHLLSK